MTAGRHAGSEAVRMVREAEARCKDLFGQWDQTDPAPRAAQVGLFVDFENLVLGAGTSFSERTDPVPAKALTWLCRAYRSTTIRRAYADWSDTRFHRYQQALERNGIDQQQIGHGPAHKNGADIRMAVDAMETLFLHPAVGAFVLVTGDSDFAPLVSKLREHGEYIIGVGAEPSASAQFVSACTEYVLWGSVLGRVDRADPPTETAQPESPFANPEDLLMAAMEQITTATPTTSQVKAKMVELDPSFDHTQHGVRTFRDFVGVYGPRVRTVGTSGQDITLGLTDASTTGRP